MISNHHVTRQTYVEDGVLGVLASLAVIARFIARARTNAGFGADDFFIVLALFSLWACLALNIWSK